MAEASDIVIRLKNGDRSAFDALYWQYHHALYRNALRITKNTTDAEDVLQEVFVRLWEKRHTIDPHQSIAGWLFVVSFNCAVKCVSKRLREMQMKTGLSADDKEDATSAWDNAEWQYHLLKEAISQLSLQKQKVFTLCKIEGKSYEETARLLNISRYTVKEYLSAAMAKVTDYVRQHARNVQTAGLLAFITWYLP
ncbi:RNA polymerase sigma factor [Compostibacter hankyongensis]|uniref:RNA polymerase sigma-70 factor n=1 Tax=Compostibacter hankyongensis TaxID=1007089 RepID=A0ABP8FBJ2_9BACT